jgi:hypothetical protein
MFPGTVQAALAVVTAGRKLPVILHTELPCPLRCSARESCRRNRFLPNCLIPLSCQWRPATGRTGGRRPGFRCVVALRQGIPRLARLAWNQRPRLRTPAPQFTARHRAGGRHRRPPGPNAPGSGQPFTVSHPKWSLSSARYYRDVPTRSMEASHANEERAPDKAESHAHGCVAGWRSAIALSGFCDRHQICPDLR